MKTFRKAREEKFTGMNIKSTKKNKLKDFVLLKKNEYQMKINFLARLMIIWLMVKT